MPLFACSRCKTVDNTALGDYWSRQHAPLCSECSPNTGKTWHGHFPKEDADNGNWEVDHERPGTKFLSRRSAHTST